MTKRWQLTFTPAGRPARPKLVAHTHRGQLAAALGGAALGGMTDDDVVTASLPLFHVGGTIFCGLSAFMSGVELIVMSPAGMRNPAMVSGFWRIVERHRVTLAGAVPTSMGAVLEVPVGDADLRTVRAGFCGAASLPLAVGERFREITGRTLYEVYGMTEASGLIAIDPTAGPGGAGSGRLSAALHRGRDTTARGRRLAGRALRDRRGLRVDRAGTDGFARLPRSRAQSRGVRRRDAQHRRPGGTDATGRIHIAGRAKDLIIRSGHNIDPLMIESAMQRHPAVALAAAVAMPDAYAGELPVCYVALRPGVVVTEAELREHAESVIAERPAWPRHIYVIDAIPLTSVGKIYKPPLRRDAAARLVKQVVQQQLGLQDAEVQAREGGPRGLTVSVSLPHAQRASLSQVRQALSDYLFELELSVV